MKMLLLTLLVLCTSSLATASASTLYFKDFSAAHNQGWVQRTRGDNSFHDTWSVSSSVEEDDTGNRYARFDYNITAEPSSANTKWWGGFWEILGEFVTLPPVWELSFQIYMPSPEPVRVAFLITEIPLTFPPPPQIPREKELYFWVTPAGSGWQEITVHSSDVTMTEVQGGPAKLEAGTGLQICLSSHDAQGNPLSIAEVGEYVLLLDDVRFSIPVSPLVSIHPRPDGMFSLFYSGTLQACDELGDWTTPSPQPEPHSLVTPAASQYFRAITD